MMQLVRPGAYRTGDLAELPRIGQRYSQPQMLARIAVPDVPPGRLAEPVEQHGQVAGQDGVLAADVTVQAGEQHRRRGRELPLAAPDDPRWGGSGEARPRRRRGRFQRDDDFVSPAAAPAGILRRFG